VTSVKEDHLYKLNRTFNYRVQDPVRYGAKGGFKKVGA